MLYTSRPLERIYYDHNTKNNDEIKSEKSTEYKEVIIENGRVIAKRMGDKYVVDYINSTDMSNYLNISYTPGKEII